jgi:ABC-type multidrug transport system ATPase subunit
VARSDLTTGWAAPATTGRCEGRVIPGGGKAGLMLCLRRAGRWFGTRRVFSELDLDVPAGMRLLLAGGNGSGKTTLLRCLAGTLALSAGEARVCGFRVGSLSARCLVGVCLAPEPGLYGKLTAHDQLTLVARLRLPSSRVAEAVVRVEWELEMSSFAAVPLQRCSAGTRARVAVGRALIGDPAVLLLDEPGSFLDNRARGMLWAALDRRPDIACVMASHNDADKARCHDTLTLRAYR